MDNNIRVIITPKADIAIADLIKKFNLEESDEEQVKKAIAGKLSKEIIICNFTKDFARGTLPQKDLVSSLQKLRISKPQAAT